MIKYCEFCGKSFEIPNTVHGKRKRFCNTSCSAKWRIKTYGVNSPSEEGRKQLSDKLKKKWDDPSFRENNYKRMTTNNPVYQDGVIDKIRQTRLINGSYTNNFKYGNGKISPSEQLAYNLLIPLGYYYNYAIPTKIFRDAYPTISVPNSYKPDFVHLIKKVCIEIDGKNHNKNTQQILDNKKEECLQYLGFTVIRFTNDEVEKGELKKWLNSNQEKF